MCRDPACKGHPINRRAMLSLAAAGALSAVGLPAAASGKAQAIMLSCMDFRLVDDLVKHMESVSMHDEYDHVVLAGASLGAVDPTFETWHQTFWDHVGLAVKLHKVEEIVVIDHRDCGAYKLALGEEAIATPEKETETHMAVFARFAAEAKSRYPDLTVRGYLMALDGTVVAI